MESFPEGVGDLERTSNELGREGAFLSRAAGEDRLGFCDLDL